MICTIVFADNERRIRQVCKQELEAEGYRVLLAEDGEDAVDIVEAFLVHLVVLDEHMPRCSGLEAARRIKLRCPNVPVILYTCDPDYAEFKSAMIDMAVIKSGDMSTLSAAIDQMLAASRIDRRVQYPRPFDSRAAQLTATR